jgi:hypothetical protein
VASLTARSCGSECDPNATQSGNTRVHYHARSAKRVIIVKVTSRSLSAKRGTEGRISPLSRITTAANRAHVGPLRKPDTPAIAVYEAQRQDRRPVVERGNSLIPSLIMEHSSTFYPEKSDFRPTTMLRMVPVALAPLAIQAAIDPGTERVGGILTRLGHFFHTFYPP